MGLLLGLLVTASPIKNIHSLRNKISIEVRINRSNTMSDLHVRFKRNKLTFSALMLSKHRALESPMQILSR